MAALFNFFGVFVMTRINNEVAVTITSMVNFGDNAGSTVIIVLCAAMLAIVIWATLAWVFGIPTSESHALIAGLTGGAMALEGVGAIVWSQWARKWHHGRRAENGKECSHNPCHGKHAPTVETTIAGASDLLPQYRPDNCLCISL